MTVFAPELPQARASRIATTVAPGIAALKRDDWNALITTNDLYCSYEWLASLERLHGPSPVFVATHAETGTLLGAIPTWRGDDSALFNAAELSDGLLGNDGGWVWLGGHRVTSNTLVCQDGTERHRILQALVEEVRAYAARRGLRGALWPYLTHRAAIDLTDASPQVRLLLHSADAILSVPTGGFEAALARAKRKDRRNASREVHTFAAHGGRVRWYTLDEAPHDVTAELLAHGARKHNAPHDAGWFHRVLAAQSATGLGERAVVAIASAHDHPVSAAIFYHRNGTRLYGRYFGAADHAPPGTYYVTTIYTALDWAAANGFDEIHLSISTWEAKVRRGAQLHPLTLGVIRAHGPAITESAAQTHNARQAQRWRHRFATRPDALATTWSHWESP